MNACDRLPAVELRDARDGRPVRLRAPELGSMILFFPHVGDCAPCRSWLTTLSGAETVFRNWEGRLIVVVAGAREEAAGAVPGVEENPHLYVVEDADGALARTFGTSGDAALVIADRFGECFHAVRATAEDHDPLPDFDEVKEWLTFLAIQCPECGVPDTAGHGGWKVTR